jgi:muramoyltetrapeptide carboxypeptidase
MSLSPSSRIKPPALRYGDTVGIVAPASNIKKELLLAGCDTLHGYGYKTFYFDSIVEQDLYFAGSVQRRARELEEMFRRDDIRAIFCARGGYGSNYLLGELDQQVIAGHPKIFMGYSDLTTLLTWFADSLGLITFHGPMGAKDFAVPDGVDFASLESALTGAANWQIDSVSQSGLKPLIEGSAHGILYGGCLSMLAATLGTPVEIKTASTILFIEDIATKPYQIDRMLMHLKLAGKLNDVRGIIFGEMIDCRQPSTDGKKQTYSLEEVVLRIVGDLGIPVAFGLPSGHVSRQNITLPIGVDAQLIVNANEVKLIFLEAATTPQPISSAATK